MYLFIHRKDLRTTDLRAFDALKRRGLAGIHLFILDPQLVGGERLARPNAQAFLSEVARLASDYRQAGAVLHLLFGEPAEVVAALLDAHPIAGVVAHADYTPYARVRDARIAAVATARGISWTVLEDRALAPPETFQAYTGRQTPYQVFTPFYNKWLSFLAEHPVVPYAAQLQELRTVAQLDAGVTAQYALPAAAAAALNLSSAGSAQREQELEPELTRPEAQLQSFIDSSAITKYKERRDSYAEDGTSGLSRYLNSGALSVRKAYEAARYADDSGSWVRQLAWRDFYLYQAVYNPDFFTYEQKLELELAALSDRAQAERHLSAWREATTGIPVIDAAMTELATAGTMPNRLRMVTAMFLTKNLLCPFPAGEAHFRERLLDYDNALNRGGWLWSSSLGYDPAPYFRIMNPVSQSMQHDPEGAYIRRWLPQLRHLDNKAIHQPQTQAIVDLKASRARAIEVYGRLLR